jgi:hypothetical protein
MVSGGSTNGRYRAHLQQQLLQKPDTLCATWNLKMRTTMSCFSINFAYAMRATPRELRQTHDGTSFFSLEKEENLSLVTETSSHDLEYLTTDIRPLNDRKSYVPVALDQRREIRLHSTQVSSQDNSRHAACIEQRSEECFPSWRRSAYIYGSSLLVYTNSHQCWMPTARPAILVRLWQLSDQAAKTSRS